MSNIRPYIIINGKNSNEINGLIISSLPPISKPPMRAMSEEIDGRDGDIITKLGFSAYDKTIQIGLAGNYDVNAVIEYFNQEGIIIFSNEPDKYYRFTQLNGIDFEKLIRFKTASVTFHCQPFKYSNSESPLNFFEPQTVEVTNSGNIYSKPELAITGKGFVDMKINNQDVLSLDFGESQQTLIIDSEKMNCYGARSNINKLDVAINPKQDLNGYESVWLAPNETAPYHTRINSNIGNLALEKLVGVSCVFNQLAPSGYSQSSNGLSPLTNGTQIIQGHKYYISRKLSTEEPVENNLFTKNGGTNKVAFKIFDTQKSTIVNALYSCISDGTTNDTEGNAWLYQYNGGSVVTVSDLNIIDLTAMFGTEVADYIYTLESGNAGAGVNLFKSLFADEYYPYTANILMSAKPTGKKIVGFNQWDEEWELGSYSWGTGLPFTDNTRIRNKNYIPVFPNINYFNSNSGYAVDYYFYDANKNFISPLYKGAGNQTITTPTNCYYMNFCMYASYGTTYNHDICINISDESKNGTYEPYSETTIVYSGNELRGLLKVGTDGLYADGDIDDGSGSTQVRYGIVDLGTLNWVYDSGVPRFYSTDLSTVIKKPTDNNIPANVICSKYPTANGNAVFATSDLIVAISTGGAVNIKDSNYTSKSAFETAMNGVYLIYELVTPTTAVSTAWSNPIIAKEGGTEEFTDSRSIKMFTGHDTIYGNICVINGWNECSVYRNGVNQWDEVTEAGSIDATTGANATDSSKLRSKNYIAVKSGKSYYFHTNNYDVNIYGYDSNKAFVSAIGTATKDESITIPNGIDYLRFVIESGYGTTYNHDISINYPSTITSYIEFEGVSNTFDLGNDTVYGGVLDVATGILKLSCVLNTLGAFNYTYSDGYFKTDDLSDVVKAPADHDSKIKSVCEAFVYRKWNELANYDNSYAFDGTTGELRIKCSEITDASSFKSLMRNIHILYEVISPVEIQLTAWEIISLIGENNIFANTGEIEECVYTKDGSEHEASGDIITFTINAHDIISDTLRNRLVTGNYDNVRFKIGKNTITFIGLPDEAHNVGEVDELSVSNYSRWL